MKGGSGYYEAVFRKCGHDGHDADDACTVGIYRVFRPSPRRHSLLAARDGLDKTIQHAIDGSCAPGLFPLVSVPTISGCIGALLIVTAAIATPIAKTQQTREIWFYAMSGGAVLKILTVEIARIVH